MAGYNTTTLGDNESTNVFFSNPIFQNATTENRRIMLKNHTKRLSSRNVDPCLRDTNSSQVSTNFANCTANNVSGVHATSSNTNTNNTNPQRVKKLIGMNWSCRMQVCNSSQKLLWVICTFPNVSNQGFKILKNLSAMMA